MTTPSVLARDEGAVRVLTLSRPDAYNAFTLAAIRELRAAVEDAIAAPRVRALVLTGAGKAFCSGGDVQEMLSNAHRA